MASGAVVDAPLTLKEFLVAEPVPLASIFRAVFEFLAERGDAVIFGAQAVNAYVGEPRMTSDVDVLSIHARELAEELRRLLADEFHVAMRVREIKDKGFRVYQARKEGPRHLVDVRQVDVLPPAQRSRGGPAVIAPLQLVVMKIRSLASRGHLEKGLTDRLDILRLLREFPEFRKERAEEISCLLAHDSKAATTWEEILTQVPAKRDRARRTGKWR